MAAVPRRAENLTPFGRRVVTALVYSDKTQAQLANHLRIDVKTLQRTLRGERDFRDDEVRKILTFTRVPEWFLRNGFNGAAVVTSPAAEQGEDLMQRLESVAQRLESAVQARPPRARGA